MYVQVMSANNIEITFVHGHRIYVSQRTTVFLAFFHLPR